MFPVINIVWQDDRPYLLIVSPVYHLTIQAKLSTIQY